MLSGASQHFVALQGNELWDAARVHDKLSIREVAGFRAADANGFTNVPTLIYTGDHFLAVHRFATLRT